MHSVDIILPAYNEELTIAGTIEAFHATLPDARIIIIDNNSSDDTHALARETLLHLNANGMVRSEPRQGKGNAVRLAFMLSDADIVVISDADLTYPAHQLQALIQPILDQTADMVVGDRHSDGHYRRENKRNFHKFGNALVTWLINTIFHANLVDIMSGFRAFNRRFVKSYPVLVGGFQIEVDMTLHALDKRFRILEVPIEYKDRPNGSFSKLRTFADGYKVLFTIFQILRYYRPMMFFGYLSAILVVLGGVAAIPVFQDWFTYRYIYHLPLAVLAAALELAAIIFFAVGLILDSLTHFHKMDYERDRLSKDREF